MLLLFKALIDIETRVKSQPSESHDKLNLNYFKRVWLCVPYTSKILRAFIRLKHLLNKIK